jgi:hypothetical protein
LVPGIDISSGVGVGIGVGIDVSVVVGDLVSLSARPLQFAPSIAPARHALAI